MEHPHAGVYAIRNLTDGKIYVGSALNVGRRWRDHRKHLKAGTHGNLHLQRAYAKHGVAAFQFEVLESLLGVDGLREAEQRWLDTLRGCDRERGYNIQQDTARRTLSDETRARMSAARLGKKRTPEQVAALRLALTGLPKSPEAREAIRRARLRFLGLPEDTPRGPARLRRYAEHLSFGERVSLGLQGHRLSDVTRERIRASKIGKPSPTRRVVSDEARVQIRERNAAGESQVALAAAFGVSRATVYNVLRGIGHHGKDSM